MTLNEGLWGARMIGLSKLEIRCPQRSQDLREHSLLRL
jgi:hypothetical protein